MEKRVKRNQKIAFLKSGGILGRGPMIFIEE
jgi:hypothetical protein